MSDDITKRDYYDEILGPPPEPEQINDIANPEKELFDVVYQWGRAGVVTDHNCPTFRRLIANVKAHQSERPF